MDVVIRCNKSMECRIYKTPSDNRALVRYMFTEGSRSSQIDLGLFFAKAGGERSWWERVWLDNYVYTHSEAMDVFDLPQGITPNSKKLYTVISIDGEVLDE